MSKKLKQEIDTMFKTKWIVDWCTEEEFLEYCKYLWDLNKDFFKSRMTFEFFYNNELILLKTCPDNFKMLYNKDKHEFIMD